MKPEPPSSGVQLPALPRVPQAPPGTSPWFCTVTEQEPENPARRLPAHTRVPCFIFSLFFFFFLRFSIFKEGADVCGQGLPAVPRPRAGPAPRSGAVPGPGDVRGGWGGISGPASAAAPPRTLHCSYP